MMALSAMSCDEQDHSLDCDDTYPAECLDLKRYMFCNQGTLTVMTCSTGYYCEYIAPGVNGNPVRSARCARTTGEETPSFCNENATKCENNTEWVCHNNQWVNVQTCAKGCSGTQCVPSCDCTTGANCSDEERNACGILPICNCLTKLNCSESQLAACPKNCLYTCDGNTLNAECTDIDSYSVTCAAGCHNGKCIDMVIEDKGQTCNASYLDRCVGNLLAYCTEETVAAQYCAGTSSCQISKTLDGFATCAKTCDTPSEPAHECIYSEDYGFYYVVQSVCEAAEDGNNYQFRKVLDICYTGCNDENTGCRFDKENTECNASEPASCSADKSYSMYCYEDEENGSFWTGDLCPEGASCVIDGEGNASCTSLCSEQEVGNREATCSQVPLLYMIDAAGEKVCTQIADGVYAWIVDESSLELCPKSCDRETGQCVLLDEKEGQKCTNSSDDACKDEIAVYCNTSYQTIMAENCRDYGPDYHCIKQDGYLGCVETCTEKGAVKSVCEDKNEYSGVIDYTCTETEQGLVWLGNLNHYCNDICDENGHECKQLFDEEFSSCTPESFPDQCINGSAAWCDNGTVAGLDCASERQICVVDDTNFADCYYLCTTPGKVTSSCNIYTSVTATYKCTRLENGVLIDIPDPASVKTCTKGCNNNNTGCAK